MAKKTVRIVNNQPETSKSCRTELAITNECKKLIISICSTSKNNDGSSNTNWVNSLMSFAQAAVDGWKHEAGENVETGIGWRVEYNKPKEANLLVGTPGDLLDVENTDRGLLACVAILADNEWNEALHNLLSKRYYDVRMIVRGKRVKDCNTQPFRGEDILQFSGILKKLERAYLRASEQNNEEQQCKNIAWKCKLAEGMKNSSFISFFSDPAMVEMGHALKNMLINLDRRIAEVPSRELKKVYSILLLGESGTGKTLAAQWIAQQLNYDLVSINVSTLPKNMVDIELFGSVKSSFTGAEDKAGIFEKNANKAIFLDEIGDMEPESQIRLLKYLDNGEVRRMGGDHPEQYYSIIIAATNRPLDKWLQMDESLFRADLYYRFGYVIKIPSLKDRKKDMRLLISLILQDPQWNEADADGHHRIGKISLDAIEYLESASYPGNFRELAGRISVATYKAILEGSSTLCLRHLVLL
jgi:hypothetical protein